MTHKTILITGANGEIGHALINYFAEHCGVAVIAMDVTPMDAAIQSRCQKTIVGDILDPRLIQRFTVEYTFDVIYHLAALLSTSAERNPQRAHNVNANGTLNILEIALTHTLRSGKPVKFLYPSSIAVYGLPNIKTKKRAGKVKENEWCDPRTMYGATKLYGEQLGIYYSRYYRQLDPTDSPKIDFRCLRFPGLISALTVPSGGTSDFAPEMLHYAAQDKPYKCFARKDTRIPFMAMPDGVKSLLMLESAPREKLSQQVYNVGAFNPSAGEIHKLIKGAFPNSQITFEPDVKRQAILDSWCADVDDSAARKDWKWKPDYNMVRAFEEYLIPAVRERYGKG